MEIIGWPAGRAEQINTASHTYCVHINRPLQVAGCLKRNTTCLVVAILGLLRNVVVWQGRRGRLDPKDALNHWSDLSLY